ALAPTELADTSITLVTFEGPAIVEPLQRHAPDFAAQTGIEVNIVNVPFGELYDAMPTDIERETYQYDIVVFPPFWMVDYASAGYLEDLTDRIAADSALQWNDIAPFFRDFSAAYDGRTYTIPLDGDLQMVYYRTDLLEAAGFDPPATWQDYLTIAEHFHEQDLNGDGTPDYGSCIAKKSGEQAYLMLWSVASAFIQTQGTQQGAFFNTETMEPLVNNEAMAAALDIFAQTTAYGPPEELTVWLPEIRTLFLTGRCALTIDWGDIGTLAADQSISQISETLGVTILPGSSRVLDRATGTLVECTTAQCPFAIDLINYAPFAASGGWAGGISSGIDESKKAAAYAFLSYMSQPAQANGDVTIGATGFNPYRISQFTNRDAWLAAGLSEAAAGRYLGAIGASLGNPNIVLDLRIPQNQRYQSDVFDAVMAEFLAGTLTTEEAMQQIYDEWETITDEVGRDVQLGAYRASLGLSNQ
ncbi:MAG: extracellular solute-binding protein, partial [Chloroflexaceae bacterium]|nr:extracellular solute-binding protein [Chloroflexaceae bacterium]